MAHPGHIAVAHADSELATNDRLNQKRSTDGEAVLLVGILDDLGVNIAP